MRRNAIRLLASVLLLLTLIFSQNGFAQPSTVTLPGSFETVYGCPVWEPNCNGVRLTETSEGIWEGTFNIPAGSWEFKVAYDNSWSVNYGFAGIPGGPNIPLLLTGAATVHFRYSEYTHLVDISFPTPPGVPTQVVLAGSFQSELGCTGDWQPNCPATALVYQAANKLFVGDLHLMPGIWEFKVTHNGSWAENYGEGGVAGGSNIQLNIAIPGMVSFTYNPVTHLISYTFKPDTVVIPGSFQGELGCQPYGDYTAGDWEPDCNATRLTWDAHSKAWTGTFDISAGNWEFKVALNNSWAVNYGQNGILGGTNMPLNLEGPATIRFLFDPVTHMVSLQYLKVTVCATAFYDANANGSKDWGENAPIEGVAFNLWGKASATQYAGPDGKTCFAGVPTGVNTIEATLPGGYLPTMDSQTINLYQPAFLNFGMVCLGGAGARDIGFWMSKQGQAVFEDSWKAPYLLQWMAFLNLRNEDGSRFVPTSYTQLRAWLQRANAKNMVYKVSAQLAVLFLNTELGMVNGSRMVYAPSADFVAGDFRDFASVYALIGNTSQVLYSSPLSRGGDANRYRLEHLKNILEQVNGDRNFVQLQPCTSVTTAKKGVVSEVAGAVPSAVIGPNPSGSHFTLRPAATNGSGDLQVRVLDVHGKLLYTATGPAGKQYRFGEGFKPGLYFVEIVQGANRSTVKVVKQ
jgi:hypothetical protein